jgi:DnaB-like helicase N terminal domain/AAA domain
VKNGEMPFSEDGEKGVICSLLQAPGEVASLCSNRLGPGAFYIPAHQILYDTILEWDKPGQEVDSVWLTQTLRDRNQIEECGGKETVCCLYTFVPTAANAEYYIKIILEKHQRRRAILLGRKLIDRCSDEHDEAGLGELENEFSQILHGTNGASLLNWASLLDYSQRQINNDDTLLGNRYLCRIAGMFVFAPSGIGKSVMAVQAAIEFAIGRVSFGIKPARPVKSLIIQAEDDEGDTIEMSHIVDHLKLSEAQKKQVHQNTWMEFVNDLTGHAFVRRIDQLLEERPSDLLWINPYSSYLGADIKDDRANALFLRNWLNPVLTKHGCGAIIVAHTPKTNYRDTSDWKPSDWMYAGAGAAILTNWARAVLVVDPTDTYGVFRFIAAKRAQRIGWQENQRFYAHSREEGKLLWVPADADQVALAKDSRATQPADALQIIPKLDSVKREIFYHQAKLKLHLGEKRARTFLEVLIDEGKIFEWRFPRKTGPPAIAYSQRRQPDEEDQTA